MARRATISLVLIAILSVGCVAVVYNTIMLTKSPCTGQLIQKSEGEAMNLKFANSSVWKAAQINKSEWGPIVGRPWK